MRRPRPLSFALMLTLCWPLAPLACTSSPGEATAMAMLEPLGDNSVRGTVEFARVSPDKVRIRAELSGLTPGLHGIHIHEFGDCSAPDGSSAGDHFNPDRTRHGGPEGPRHHRGDLGNIEANAAGRATLNFTTDAFTLDDGPRGILGRSLVVHAMADDLVTDPSGNSCGRIACAVIRTTTGATKPVLPSS